MAFGKKAARQGFVSTASSSAGNRMDNQTSWSQRYSGGRGGMIGVSGVMPRWVGPALAVMLLVIILGAVFCVPAMIYRGKSEMTFINRMTTECDDALNLANSLSRSGGAADPVSLSRIRADVSAIEAINETRNSITAGGYYIQPYVFADLYNVIDSYYGNLQLGNVTMQNLTELVRQLEALQGMLFELR